MGREGECIFCTCKNAFKIITCSLKRKPSFASLGHWEFFCKRCVFSLKTMCSTEVLGNLFFFPWR